MFKKLKSKFIFFLVSASLIWPFLTLANPVTDDGMISPLGTSAPVVIGRVISSLFGVIGSIALVLFVYGGIVWMTAAGNDRNVQKGKSVLIWSTLGLAFIFFSYAVVKYIFVSIGV
jgi:hypothetical protein